jgi:hypothetical protein
MLRFHRLRVQRRNVARRTACKTDLRQTEVKNLGMPPFRDENIGWLDVAVDDPFGVCCVESVSDLNSERQNKFSFQWTATNAMLQRHPVQKLHSDKCFTILLTDVEDRADVRMVESGRSLGFALKTSQCLRVASNFIGQELEGYKTMEPGVFRLVDHAHAAATELLDDAVVRDGLADH